MKDLRDPALLGEALLHARPGSFYTLAERYDASALMFERVPEFPGDESPLDRYGDPRLTEVVVETVVRRLPIERLAA